MKKKIKYIVIIAAIVAIAGVVVYYVYNPKRAVTLILPDFNSLQAVKATIKNDTAFLSIEGIIQNEAPYTISIDSIAFSITLDTTLLVKEVQTLGLVQQKKQTDTIDLEARLPIKKIRGTIARLQSFDSTFIEADVEIYYNTFLGHISLPFSKKQKIKTPLPPKIKLVKVNRKKIRLFEKEAELEVLLQIDNEGERLDLELRNVQYEVQLGEGITGTGQAQQKITVKPKSVTTVTLPLVVKVSKPGKAVWNIITDNDEVPYNIKLSAQLHVGSIEGVPVELTAVGITELF